MSTSTSPNLPITVRVGIGKDDSDGGFGLAVEIIGELPGIASEKAMALMQSAHGECPKSKATSGNVVATQSVID